MRKTLGSLFLSAPFRANARFSSKDRNERNYKLLNIVSKKAYTWALRKKAAVQAGQWDLNCLSGGRT